MVAKNTRFILSIFGMLIAAGLILLATVLSAQAQDFEPDRRPDCDLVLSLDFKSGSLSNRGSKTISVTTVGAPQIADRVATFGTAGQGYRWANASEFKARNFSFGGFCTWTGGAASSPVVFGQTVYTTRETGAWALVQNKSAEYSYIGVGGTSPADDHFQSFGTTGYSPKMKHYFCVVSGSSVSTYVDGLLFQTNAGADFSSVGGATTDFALGGVWNLGTWQGYAQFLGLVSVQQYYSRDLSASEVYSLFKTLEQDNP